MADLTSAQSAFPVSDENDFTTETLQCMYLREQQQQLQLQTPGPTSLPSSPFHSHRRLLIELIIRLCESMGLQNETSFHACELLDRVFMTPKFNRADRVEEFALIAIACVMIAAKYNERHEKVPPLKRLSAFAHGQYTTKQLCAAEIEVLNSLQWRLSCVTPLCFARYFLSQLRSGDLRLDMELHRKTVLLLALSLQHPEFRVSFLPSQLAAAALLSAMYPQLDLPMINQLPFRAELETILGYSFDDLIEAQALLRQRYQEFVFLRCQQQQLQQQLPRRSPKSPLTPSTPLSPATPARKTVAAKSPIPAPVGSQQQDQQRSQFQQRRRKQIAELITTQPRRKILERVFVDEIDARRLMDSTSAHNES